MSVVPPARARPPFDGAGVLRWLGARLVRGVEELTEGVYRRTLRLPGGTGVVALEPRDDHVRVRLELADPADRAAPVTACRSLPNLHADPATHKAPLAADPARARSVGANPGPPPPG